MKKGGNLKNNFRKKTLYYSCLAMSLTQIIIALGILIYYSANSSLGLSKLDVFSTALAMSALLSIALMAIGWIIYALYNAKALFIGLFMLALFFCLFMATLFNVGVEPIILVLTGAWMRWIHRLIFCLIGILVFSLSIWYICFYESDDTSRK